MCESLIDLSISYWISGSEIPNNQTFPTTWIWCEEISCLNTGIKTYQLSPGWVELSCLPDFWLISGDFGPKITSPKLKISSRWRFDVFFFVFGSKLGYFESPFPSSQGPWKSQAAMFNVSPSGNDPMSHQTIKGNSSTQTCQTVGDKYPFPRGYSGCFFRCILLLNKKIHL